MSLTPGVSMETRIMLCCPCLTYIQKTNKMWQCRFAHSKLVLGVIYAGVVDPWPLFSCTYWMLAIKSITCRPCDLTETNVEYFCNESSKRQKWSNMVLVYAQGIKNAGGKRANARLTCCLPSQTRSCTSQWPLCTWDCQHLWKKKKKSPNQWQLWLMPLKPQILQQVNIPNAGTGRSGWLWPRGSLGIFLAVILLGPVADSASHPGALVVHPDGQISCFHIDPSG